ncbi:hypothetical protein FOMPIDRAFT_1049976 [Fomitopsis schrenkii]|uniref:Uncharacterized protein n=1 Tax=Fomitopsis schrenkii TaxID=2126942 RepID=S8FFB5_FOMSC|nr:hypothetical protein FOMPIDRAFT_1049976 [Fomitopsis schrenkii]
MQVQSFKASLALEDVFLFVIVHILKRLVIAPVVSIPTIVGQCIAMCFLPVPYGEAYHAADIGQTIRVGWLGAVFIATFVCIAVVFSSIFRLHTPTCDTTPRSALRTLR